MVAELLRERGRTGRRPAMRPRPALCLRAARPMAAMAARMARLLRQPLSLLARRAGGATDARHHAVAPARHRPMEKARHLLGARSAVLFRAVAQPLWKGQDPRPL